MNQTIKKFSTKMRSAAIKSKRELIQIVGQLGRSDGTLIRSQKPSFEQGGYQVRQLEFFRGKGFPLISQFSQFAISRPVVRLDHAARRNHILYKSTQAIRRGIHYLGQANSSKFLGGFVFNGNRHQCFSFGSSPLFSRLSTAYIRFIHLHAARQLIPARSHHGPSQSMEPLPGGLVTAQAQHPLQTQSIGTIFLAGNVPHGPKPKGQRFMGPMEDCPCGDRGLSATLLTMPQPSFRLPSVLALAFWTNKTIRPTKHGQVFQAGRLRSKSFFKFCQGPGIIFHDPKHYIL